MANIGGLQHEQLLDQKIEEYIRLGYKVIKTDARIPDAIAIKDNRVIALEIMGRKHKVGKGWRKTRTMKNIKEKYYMYDEVVVYTFRLRLPTQTPLLPLEK